MSLRYAIAGLALFALPSALVMAAGGPTTPPPNAAQVRGALSASLAEDGARVVAMELDGCRALGTEIYGATVYACAVAYEEIGARGQHAEKSVTLALIPFDTAWRVVRR